MQDASLSVGEDAREDPGEGVADDEGQPCLHAAMAVSAQPLQRCQPSERGRVGKARQHARSRF